MLQALPLTIDTQIFHRDIWVKSFGYGMAKSPPERFSFEQFNQLLLFLNQVVDFGGFMVEEIS